MAKEKVVLAYSGGLDTSCILKWLIEKGYEIIAVAIDLGQKEDFKEVEEKALKVGASKFQLINVQEEFVKDFVFPAIKANAKYEGKYLLGTSLARPLIAKKLVEVAKKEKAQYISHGATGKGNDQVRFELTASALAPELKFIVPWRTQEFLDQFQGRNDLIEYAEKHNIPVKASKKAPWSTDPNVMHISYEAGILEDPWTPPPEEMYEMVVQPKDAPDKETVLEIEFKKGIPVKVKHDGKEVTGALKLFEYLNKVGGENGVGIIDMVENRFVGMKSRGSYETPAGTILFEAHLDIEGITMDREVKLLRDGLIPKYATLIYNGFWFAPEMEFLQAAFDKSQENVEGTVKLSLYKGNIKLLGRKSPNSLYDEKIASMDEHGGYDQKDATGFIKLNALRLKARSKKK
ncbi:argininosuccinate synthase [Nanoarchaeota archaeon]